MSATLAVNEFRSCTHFPQTWAIKTVAETQTMTLWSWHFGRGWPQSGEIPGVLACVGRCWQLGFSWIFHPTWNDLFLGGKVKKRIYFSTIQPSSLELALFLGSWLIMPKNGAFSVILTDFNVKTSTGPLMFDASEPAGRQEFGSAGWAPKWQTSTAQRRKSAMRTGVERQNNSYPLVN